MNWNEMEKLGKYVNRKKETIANNVVQKMHGKSICVLVNDDSEKEATLCIPLKHIDSTVLNN